MKMTKLAQMRKAKGFTQTDLAKKLGCRTSTISDYERGARQPNITKLQNIANALDCRISDLI